MSNRRPPLSVSSDDLVENAPRQSTSMSLPLPVVNRLDLIAERARKARPTRAEIIAALIAAAPLDADELVRLMMDYRDKTVGEVLASEAAGTDEAKVVTLLPRAPGRPRSAPG
jgi:hypothetical protein